ncbi:MAG TPA: HAD-IA family hydrolase [Bryobacteraceae bacterium]|nr:HAD-IA family hydrolase [Bryobacteraceae bacterium]
MIPAFPVYLFDVDGTLLDSAADICGAMGSALQELALEQPCSEAFLRGYIGLHLRDLIRDLLPNHTPDQFDAFLNHYRSLYVGRQHGSTRAFPGVAEALSCLPGRKSTATTKQTATTRAVLEQFGLLRYFDHVQGTDGFPAKPAPDVVFKSLEIFGVPPEDCLLVGDAAADMEAGRRAGVRLCAVTYGYGDRAKIAAWQPDYWIDDLRELCAAVPASSR